MSRIDRVKRGVAVSETLQDLTDDTISLRQTFKSGLQSLLEKFDNVQLMPARLRYAIRAYYTRMYAFALAEGILLNCILEDLVPEPSEYREESASFTFEIIRMAEQLLAYRPVGTLILGFVLSLAFVGAPDDATRARLNELYANFRRDFGSNKVEPVTLKSLQRNMLFRNALRSRGYFDAGEKLELAPRFAAENG